MPTCGGWAARGGAASRWPFRNGEDLQAAGITLGRDYPLPVVDHAQARTETLRRYAGVKAG